jgi:hypothetical protein
VRLNNQPQHNLDTKDSILLPIYRDTQIQF